MKRVSMSMAVTLAPRPAIHSTIDPPPAPTSRTREPFPSPSSSSSACEPGSHRDLHAGQPLSAPRKKTLVEDVVAGHDWMRGQGRALFEFVRQFQKSGLLPTTAENIMPTGRPETDSPSGNEIAGSPVTFCSGVNATHSNSRSMTWS